MVKDERKVQPKRPPHKFMFPCYAHPLTLCHAYKMSHDKTNTKNYNDTSDLKLTSRDVSVFIQTRARHVAELLIVHVKPIS